MANNFTYKDLVVVYEDNHIIVVLNPQNVPSQADETKDMDMLTAVKQYIKVKNNKPGEAYVGLVHRLDRPTGGVMVFAKTSKAAERLCEQIKDGEFEKEYYAVVCGEPKLSKDTLTNYLKKDEKNNKVELATMSEEGSKKAVLHYEVKESKKGYSLCKIALETGRSHQIRVQMAAIGCPLYGDQKYGLDHPETFKVGKLALWATKLSFNHPVQKDRRTFIVYPPVEEAPWKAFEVNRYLNIGVISNPYEISRQKENLASIATED